MPMKQKENASLRKGNRLYNHQLETMVVIKRKWVDGLQKKMRNYKN